MVFRQVRAYVTIPSGRYIAAVHGIDEQFREGLLVRGYADLVRVPGVLGVTSAQLFARLPLGVLSLAILIHVQSQSGSYALAGGGVACVSVGEAIAMPLTARLAGTLGIVRTLLTTAGINACATLAVGFSV